MPWPLFYTFCFAGSCAVGAAFTAASRAAGRKLGVLDRPAGRKSHERPIAVTGGWGVFAAFFLLAGLGGWAAPSLAGLIPDRWEQLRPSFENMAGVRKQLAGIMIGVAWVFLVGAVDDVRPLGPRVKLIAQIVSVLPLIYAGISIRLFLPFPVLGWIVTAAWVVLLLNSFNFIDNMDGLCATVAAVIAVVLAVAAYQGGQFLRPALYVLFAGTLVGFLFFNFNPASIFLGDAGSLTVGYLMAVFSIMTTFYAADRPSGLPVLIPLAVMGVPLFDTASVLLIRWRSGKPLMVGDQNHFSHRLRDMGFSIRQTVATIGLLTGAVGLLSLPLRHLAWPEAILHLAALVMLFGVIGAIEFFGQGHPEP